jgi:DNA polymerase I-like protein with 3'-5' exonuclease and polymerase domains
MEAHYSFRYDNGEYAKELMEGDIHTKNQAALELPSRDKAKTWKYAVTYGARPKKLAKTFGWTLEIANEKYQRFWEANPALKELTESVTRSAQHSGVIRSIDGRLIPVDSTHTALNRLLQSSGAILMKYAMVIADRKIRKLGLAANGLIRYHDEEQWEADPSIAETVGKIGVRSIEAAAMYLKLKIPVTGEYKIGNTWADTH